jgi:adenylate kinase
MASLVSDAFTTYIIDLNVTRYYMMAYPAEVGSTITIINYSQLKLGHSLI